MKWVAIPEDILNYLYNLFPDEMESTVMESRKEYSSEKEYRRELKMVRRIQKFRSSSPIIVRK